jgi:hypothetical protein
MRAYHNLPAVPGKIRWMSLAPQCPGLTDRLGFTRRRFVVESFDITTTRDAMNILKKICGISVVAIALAMSASASAFSLNDLLSNKHSANKVSANKFAGNKLKTAHTNLGAKKLAGDKLTGIKLAGHRLGAKKIAGDRAFKDVSAAKLADGTGLTR